MDVKIMLYKTIFRIISFPFILRNITKDTEKKKIVQISMISIERVSSSKSDKNFPIHKTL